MAEGAVVKVLLETVKKLMMDEAYLLLGVKGHINKLQTELEWMYLSIKKADETLKSDEKLKLWVKQVRGIIFDTEDVIDEFILEIIHHKRFQKDPKALTAGLKGYISSATQLPFVHKHGNRIKEINTRVNDLKANKEKYWFESSQTTGGGDVAESSNQASKLSLKQKIERRRAEIAAEEYRDAIHIHEDSEKQVMSLLREDEGGNDKRLRVISILGMGGVGKTTLSRKAYNFVMRDFDCRAFVYISKEYSSQKHIKSIMNQCFGIISNEKESLSNDKLYELLKGKKYLIVLDDVWDIEAWDGLKSSFPDEQNGSRVLLTTRHKSVANRASGSFNSANIHKLDVINEMEISWGLFLKNAFPWYGIVDAEQFVRSINAVYLGKEMVEKCCGLPLAVVVLGSLLSNEDITQNAWARVNKKASWHLSHVDSDDFFKCSGILALSYDYLPYYLKPCFLYMSLFPEESDISATKLCQCWIAEGFIKIRGDETLEDAAEDYLEQLVSRSLIRAKKLRCDGRIKTCGIHNLLRDISITESEADQFSQIYSSIDKFYQDEKSSSRRVAVYCNPDILNKHYLTKFPYTRIRSLMCQDLFIWGFKSLRVLKFHGYTEGLVSLPKEVGELTHLRYLSFEKTKFEKVDTSYLSKLVNLETLNLKECISELKLDDQIWSIRQLRNLYLGSIIPLANKGSRWWSTANVDKLDIGNLTNLQSLVIQAGDWISSGGLKRLSSLRKLRIEECLNSHSDKISGALINLTELRSLELMSKTSPTPSSTPLINEGIPLASIQFSNHKFLKRLHVKGHIHGWTRHILFPPYLCKLKLEWSWIFEDPMKILEKLPFLTFLHLRFDAYVGKKMVCSEGGFVSLQTLEIFFSEHLEEWIIEEGALNSLVDLEIHECRRLAMIPDGLEQLSTLKVLKVTNMPPLFQSRMIQDVGDDWNKIKHIPFLNVSGF
ncbi:hypothetical protein MKW92_033727 [Papaver armeniacum]|nr:hypothetical protein MKW92_033727 [Papaver armeniacum]